MTGRLQVVHARVLTLLVARQQLFAHVAFRCVDCAGWDDGRALIAN